MKKSVKMLAWMMLAAMPMTGAAAQAGAVERAAAPLEMKSFEHYASHTYDSASGRWSVHSSQADALMDRFWSYAEDYQTALCAFHLELEGNVNTGVMTPVLRFYYADGQRDINASAVSLLVGDVRYDLAASSSFIKHDKEEAELISVPLTAESLAAVDALIEAEEASVRLIGDYLYTAELDRDTTGTRSRIEVASLNTLKADLALMEEAGLSEYRMWDLSAAAWESQYGFKPDFEQYAVVKTIDDVKILDDFGMIIRANQTNAAKKMQEILVEYGYMSGTVTTTFTYDATNAVRRAQKYLGRIVTGCMDVHLAEALAQPRETEEEKVFELQPLSDVAEVALERYWFAGGVSASESVSDMRTVLNGDNVFLAADGFIRNVAPRELHLFMEVEAKVVYGGKYEYEATIVCERNEGRELDSMLLPMAQSRMIVYAEVPAYLAQEEGADWRIELTANGETLEFELQ